MIQILTHRGIQVSKGEICNKPKLCSNPCRKLLFRRDKILIRIQVLQNFIDPPKLSRVCSACDHGGPLNEKVEMFDILLLGPKKHMLWFFFETICLIKKNFLYLTDGFNWQFCKGRVITLPLVNLQPIFFFLIYIYIWSNCDCKLWFSLNICFIRWAYIATIMFPNIY